MTRILDALKKAHSARPAAVPPISPVPQASAPMPPHGPPTGRAPAGASPGAVAGRLVEPRAGLPLAMAMDLGEELLRQMIGLQISIESALTDRFPRVVIFHAAQGGDGTTTVVHQFCRALARDRDVRVLIMDAHVVRPTIELDPARRVAVCTRSLFQTQRPEGAGPEITPNLHALPVPETHRRGRAYPVDAARELIESVSASYDWIVVDGPPVLEAPDAASLAAIADGAVLVVRAGRTKRPVLARALGFLRKSGARVIGSVLNGRQLEIPEFLYRRI